MVTKEQLEKIKVLYTHMVLLDEQVSGYTDYRLSDGVIRNKISVAFWVKSFSHPPPYSVNVGKVLDNCNQLWKAVLETEEAIRNGMRGGRYGT
jgi:hypothetical protein